MCFRFRPVPNFVKRGRWQQQHSPSFAAVPWMDRWWLAVSASSAGPASSRSGASRHSHSLSLSLCRAGSSSSRTSEPSPPVVGPHRRGHRGLPRPCHRGRRIDGAVATGLRGRGRSPVPFPVIPSGEPGIRGWCVPPSPRRPQLPLLLLLLLPPP